MWVFLAEVAVVVAVEAVVDSFFDDQGKPYGLASAVNLWGIFFKHKGEKRCLDTQLPSRLLPPLAVRQNAQPSNSAVRRAVNLPKS